ncbi:hypothetical protein FB451DRAFT_1369503 [Mycena latifolia]|nr:hypothetical protein FB451DRAFT_1369503 [Mycena latifolia]
MPDDLYPSQSFGMHVRLSMLASPSSYASPTENLPMAFSSRLDRARPQVEFSDQAREKIVTSGSNTKLTLEDPTKNHAPYGDVIETGSGKSNRWIGHWYSSVVSRTLRGPWDLCFRGYSTEGFRIFYLRLARQQIDYPTYVGAPGDSPVQSPTIHCKLDKAVWVDSSVSMTFTQTPEWSVVLFRDNGRVMPTAEEETHRVQCFFASLGAYIWLMPPTLTRADRPACAPKSSSISFGGVGILESHPAGFKKKDLKVLQAGTT